MRKKQIIVASSVIVLVAGALSTSSRTAAPTQPKFNAPPALEENGLPEHVAYEFLFRRAAHFKGRAAKAGRATALDVSLQEEMNLSEAQVRTLGDIAALYVEQASELDEQAREVIDKFRSRFPDRVVPPDETLAPPPELEALQQQRAALFARGKIHLQQVLGQKESGRLHRFVQERFSTVK